MKKPELVYPETFIAEREVDGKSEYAFSIKRTFLGIFKYTSIEPILSYKETGYVYEPVFTDALGAGDNPVYFDSPDPVKEAIDNLRKDVEDDYQKNLKTWHRKQAGDWKYKPYP